MQTVWVNGTLLNQQFEKTLEKVRRSFGNFCENFQEITNKTLICQCRVDKHWANVDKFLEYISWAVPCNNHACRSGRIVIELEFGSHSRQETMWASEVGEKVDVVKQLGILKAKYGSRGCQGDGTPRWLF